MTLRLTDEQERALVALAEADGVSKHEAVVRAITETALRRAQEDDVQDDVCEASVLARDRYASLLDRLAR